MSLCRVGAALSIVLVFASACGKKDATGVSVDVSGNWGGSGLQGGVNISFQMALQESAGGSITGTGWVTTFTSGGQGYNFTVSGKRDGSAVTMAFNIPNLVSPMYQGGLQTASM